MGCSSSNTRYKEAKILMIGPKDSGKTQILYMLKVKQTVTTIPTQGANIETVPGARGYQFIITDVGGEPSSRGKWNAYYPRNEAVVMVVDSSSVEKVKEAKELFSELNNPHLRGLPLLVLANKIDIEGGLTASQIQEQLHLKAIVDRTWALDSVAGFNGQGLDVAMYDLARMVDDHKTQKELLRKDRSLNKAVV